MIDTVPGSPLLEVRGVRKAYRSGAGRLEVLRGVDFELEPGGFVSVIGQSGSGKSTLLHLMGLLDAPDAGEVHLAGGRIDDLPVARRDRLRNTAMGMVFQAYHLLPELSAIDNVLSPLIVRHGIAAWFRVAAGARRRATALLERFGSVERIKNAAATDLAEVPGISQTLAEKILSSLQSN